MAMEAGYQALFTVYGQHMGIDAAADQLGRYAVESRHPDVFKMAVNFGNNDGVAPGVEAAQLASVAMVTQPMNEEKILATRPVIKANLATMGEVEPNSVEMRISGYGLVPARYDPKTYTVILSAKVQGRKMETRWNFTVDPSAPAQGKQAAAQGA
jgi:hypothetical protein